MLTVCDFNSKDKVNRSIFKSGYGEGRSVSSLHSIAMVGSSAVNCASCKGVVLAASRGKVNKLSMRKGVQNTIKLCTCPQPPSGSSSGFVEVCVPSPIASKNIKILDDVLLTQATTYESISSDEDVVPLGKEISSCKTLKSLLTKPIGEKRKSTENFPEFDFRKYARLFPLGEDTSQTGKILDKPAAKRQKCKNSEQFARSPATSKVIGDVEKEVGKYLKLNNKPIMEMSTPQFNKPITKSKIKKINQSPGPSQTDVFDDSFEFDINILEKEIFGTNEVVSDGAGQRLMALVDGLSTGGASSSQASTSGSRLPSPPAPPAPAPLPIVQEVGNATAPSADNGSTSSTDATVALSARAPSIVSDDVVQAVADGVVNVSTTPSASTSAVDDVVVTDVPTTSSSTEVQEDDDYDASLTQDKKYRVDGIRTILEARETVHKAKVAYHASRAEVYRARISEVESAQNYIAARERKLISLDEQLSGALEVISEKQSKITGCHSRVYKELGELTARVSKMMAEKTDVLLEIASHGATIRMLANILEREED